MFVIYQPEDGDRQEWVFNPDRVRAVEGKVLLRTFGEPSWDLFVQGVRQNDLHARRVLLWHLMRRQHPLMRFEDTPDFFTGEMEVEFSTAELAEIIDKVSAAPAQSAEKQQAIEVLTAELEAARAREEASPELAGKSSSPTSSRDTTTTG